MTVRRVTEMTDENRCLTTSGAVKRPPHRENSAVEAENWVGLWREGRKPGTEDSVVSLYV